MSDISANWYYTQQGQRGGPVSLAQLGALAAGGQLGPDEKVWHESLADWTLARQVPQLGVGAAQPAQPVAAHPAGGPPYAAAAAAGQTLGYAGPSNESTMMSRRAIVALGATRPWVRIVSVAMLVVGGFSLIAPVFTMAAARRATPDMYGAAFAQFAAGAVYLAIAMVLSSFATRIGKFERSLRTEDLEAAIVAQKTFWKISGILTLIGLGLLVLVFIFAGFAMAM